ncbi:MAG: 16S rRNA (guanine(966)-N(2))-methyltransferase RsmD [Gammaproteobacteria bacterium]
MQRTRRGGAVLRRAVGQLRIVGGHWRSRRLRFPAAPGLRPTPDRLRETLFDWLGEWIVGRRVLDLYAGSGALGIEALSRGAAEAVFIERSASVAAALRKNLARLDVAPSSRQDAGAPTARIECTDALGFLRDAPGFFDLVFLDPPYASDLAFASFALLAANPLLTPDHRVYLEQPTLARIGRDKPRSGAVVNDLPAGWELLKSARAGGARGALLRREAAVTARTEAS